MWLNKLKAAIITENLDEALRLLQKVPSDLTQKELQEASFLSREAATIATRLRDETAVTMKKIKNSIDFLHATEQTKQQKFDITS